MFFYKPYMQFSQHAAREFNLMELRKSTQHVSQRIDNAEWLTLLESIGNLLSPLLVLLRGDGTASASHIKGHMTTRRASQAITIDSGLRFVGSTKHHAMRIHTLRCARGAQAHTDDLHRSERPVYGSLRLGNARQHRLFPWRLLIETTSKKERLNGPKKGRKTR
jgi:hypothetical protein